MVFRFVPPIAFIDASRTEWTSFTGTCCADAVVATSTMTITTNVTETPSLRIVRTSVVPGHETIMIFLPSTDRLVRESGVKRLRPMHRGKRAASYQAWDRMQ